MDSRGSPVPGSSTSQPSTSSGSSSSSSSSSSSEQQRQQRQRSALLGLGEDFRLNETESFLNALPPDMFGLDGEWGGERDAILAQVLAASQKEYFESLKKKKEEEEEEEDDSSPDSPE